MAPLVFSLWCLVWVPLCDVICKEVHHVLNIAADLTTSYKTSLPQCFSSFKQCFSLQIETRSSFLPQNVMQMHHATRGAPLENGNIRTSAIEWYHDRLENEFQTNGAVPRHEQRILIHQLSPLASAQLPMILSFNLRNYPNNIIPMVALRGQRSEQRRNVARLHFCIRTATDRSRFNLNLTHHCENHSPQLRLACTRARNLRSIPHHVFGERLHTHSPKVVQCVSSGLRIVSHIPLLCTECVRALNHIEPPIAEGHVCLRMPPIRAHDVGTPRKHVRLLQHIIVQISRFILEDGGKGSWNPKRFLVCVPNAISKLWRLHQRLATRYRLSTVFRTPLHLNIRPSRCKNRQLDNGVATRRCGDSNSFIARVRISMYRTIH